MKNEPPASVPSSQPFGTTMRINISPEMLDASKRGKVASGQIRGMQPVVRVAKSRAEPTPQSSIDFLQLFQNIYDAALITDLTGEILMANIRANQFFLAEPGQLTNYNVLALICNANESLLPTILETLKENRFVLMQAFCMRIEGSFFPAEISVNRLSLGNRNHLSFFVRDITL